MLHEVMRLNHALTEDEAPTGSVTLNQALEAAMRRAKHDYLVVLISDLDGANEETKRLATLIAAHNDMLAVAIYDPLGAALQPQPGMYAEVSGERLPLPLDDKFPVAFQRAFAQRLDEWTGIFRALQVPVLPISAAEAPADQLRSLFGQRIMP